jgi:Na+/proline symporter
MAASPFIVATTAPLDTLDWIVIAAYFTAALVLGLYLRRLAARSLHDYVLGGRKIPWWILGASGTASNFDMTGTMVITSFVFAIGLQGVWVSMRGGMCLPLGLLMIYMGKWLRRSNVMTTAEWMELRFGTGRQGQAARQLSAAANLVVTLALLTYFVKGTGKFLAVFLPFSPEVCALALIAVAVVYTTLSGLYGVIFTDLAQELLMIATALYVGYQACMLPDHAAVLELASTQSGRSWSSFAPQLTAQPMHWLANPDIYHLFGLCIVFWIARGLLEGAGGLTGGYMPQRYYAAKDERAAGLMTAEWILLLIPRWILIFGIALLALDLARTDAALSHTLHLDPEKTLPIVLAHAIPAGLRGLAVAGLIAAAMSTFDSTINAGASYWVRDIYQRYLRPSTPDSSPKLVHQGYYATVTLALLAVLLGLTIPNIESIWSWITGPLSAGLFAPIVLRWYWHRFNGYGFAASTAVGLLTAIALRLAWPTCPLYINFPVTWSASLVAGILASYVTPPTDAKTLTTFWLQIRPFGLWSPVRRSISATNAASASIVARSRRQSRRDLLNIPLAIAWHLSGTATAISLLLHNWTALAVSAAVAIALSATLYFSWYRKLRPG